MLLSKIFAPRENFSRSIPHDSHNQIRDRLIATLHDCQSRDADRCRHAVYSARTEFDLWITRGPVFQVVAREHGELAASSRLANIALAMKECGMNRFPV